MLELKALLLSSWESMAFILPGFLASMTSGSSRFHSLTMQSGKNIFFKSAVNLFPLPSPCLCYDPGRMDTLQLTKPSHSLFYMLLCFSLSYLSPLRLKLGLCHSWSFQGLFEKEFPRPWSFSPTLLRPLHLCNLLSAKQGLLLHTVWEMKMHHPLTQKHYTLSCIITYPVSHSALHPVCFLTTTAHWAEVFTELSIKTRPFPKLIVNFESYMVYA